MKNGGRKKKRGKREGTNTQTDKKESPPLELNLLSR
jgi:hypothetical protein